MPLPLSHLPSLDPEYNFPLLFTQTLQADLRKVTILQTCFLICSEEWRFQVPHPLHQSQRKQFWKAQLGGPERSPRKAWLRESCSFLNSSRENSLLRGAEVVSDSSQGGLMP